MTRNTKEQQHIDITIQDITTKEISDFYVPVNCRLAELRKLVEKEFCFKNFKFLMDNRPQARQTEERKPAKLLISQNVIKIQSGKSEGTQSKSPVEDFFKALQQKQASRQPIKEPVKQKNLNNYWNEESLYPKINQKEEINWKEEKIQYPSFSNPHSIEFFYNNNLNHQHVKKPDVPIINQPQSKKLLDNKLFIDKTMKYSFQKDSCYQIDAGTGLYKFSVFCKQIDMNDFIKYDWTKVQELILYDCKVNDQKWNTLVKNAKLFDNLKIINLTKNKITAVSQNDIKQFKILQKIDFGKGYNGNPLNDPSKIQLRCLKQTHPKSQLYFE